MNSTTLSPDSRGSGSSSIRRWWGKHIPLQAAILIGLGTVLGISGFNVLETMHHLGLSPGFSFLHRPANFEISETPIAYTAGDTYARVFLAGLSNTIKVSLTGCILATFLGLTLGLLRLSRNPLVSGLIQGYVEIVRNIPLLLQLFFWSAVTHALPPPRQAFQPVEGIYFSNRGLFLPELSIQTDGDLLVYALVPILCLAAVTFYKHRFGLRLSFAGNVIIPIAAILLSVGLFFMLGGSLSWEKPELHGFNIAGGMTLSPEFAALLIGLVIHTAAQISEIVRAGLTAISSGQWEAGKALGLSGLQIVRLIVLPQAMRIITPLMTSSYMDLTKNSSLAVAIGFPDLVSVVNTSANQTGQAFEAITVLVTIYLAINLSVSVAMNRYNARLRDRGGTVK